MPPEVKLYTVQEVAQLMRVDVSTVYKAVKAGTVKSIRFGGSVRIPAKEIDKIISDEITK